MTTTNNSCISSIIIPPGGTMVLPAGAKILYTTADDVSVLTSSCPDVEEQLEAAETATCYQFAWETGDLDSGNHGAWDGGEMTVSKVWVGSTFYPIDKLAEDVGGIVAQIKANVPAGIFNFAASGEAMTDQVADVQSHYICFKTSPTLAKQIRLEFKNPLWNAVTDPLYYIEPRANSGQCSCP